ncbi:N-glycosidase R617 [Colletotrichum fructicola]|nr:N-glycosidase R617 [Colletotrichum fructicola]KAF5503973.1 N-glycosidase R617 [Colletotrichum fructicola]
MSPAKTKKPKKPNQGNKPRRTKAPTHDASESESEDTPVFFFMSQEKFKYCQFCQWYPSTFTVSKPQMSQLVGRAVDENDPFGSVTFTCAEQYMMYCKAARFGDTERQARIMCEKDPKTQKALGKEIVGFMDTSWDEVKSAVVEAVNVAKFGQNPQLKKVLMGTGNRVLAEASPKDRIWAIGFNEKQAMVNQRNWGENRLGKALMATREQLRNEDAEELEVEGNTAELSGDQPHEPGEGEGQSAKASIPIAIPWKAT